MPQIKGPGSELSKRVYNLMSVSRVLVSSGGVGGPVYVPSSAKVDEQSIFDLQEVKKLYCLLPNVTVFTMQAVLVKTGWYAKLANSINTNSRITDRCCYNKLKQLQS